MLVAVKEKPEPGLRLKEAAYPRPGKGEAVIKVLASSICGTDRHIYKWDAWAQSRVKKLPLVQGHELCGEVVELGSETERVQVGDFVSAESHIVCGQCEMCLTGNAHVCLQTKIIGVDTDGCFAQYIKLPVGNLWKNPKDMPVKQAVLMENFGNAVQAAYTAEVKGRTVLITGCGPVGCMAAAVCRARGAAVIIGSDVSAYRLDLARQMGVTSAIQASGSIVDQIMALTGGKGVDVALEMSGAEMAIQDALRVLKCNGRFIAFGLPARPIEINLSELVIFKGVKIIGVVGRRLWETWKQAAELLRSRAVSLEPIVTHEVGLTDITEGFRIMESGQSGKVIIYPN